MPLALDAPFTGLATYGAATAVTFEERPVLRAFRVEYRPAEDREPALVVQTHVRYRAVWPPPPVDLPDEVPFVAIQAAAELEMLEWAGETEAASSREPVAISLEGRSHSGVLSRIVDRDVVCVDLPQFNAVVVVHRMPDIHLESTPLSLARLRYGS